MKNNQCFLLNKVDASSQVKFPYYIEGNENASFKIMFIGNSITIHECKPEIGWFNSWGMAASKKENDYVHVVYKHFLDKNHDTSICVFNGGLWELDYTNNDKCDVVINEAKEYKPDVIVVRIGENFSKENISKNIDPFIAFNYLINGLTNVCKNIHITSQFWHYDVIDNAIKKVSDTYSLPYIKIDDLGERDDCKALGQFKHEGVSLHPSDLGMKIIAERIIDSIEKE